MAQAKPIEDDDNVVPFARADRDGETDRSNSSPDNSEPDTATAEPEKPVVAASEVTVAADEDAPRMGDVLARAREAQGLERTELAAELRISARYLAAIESMSVGPIPKGYLSAFVRTYAKRLGLDGDEVVEIYTRQCGAADEVRKPVPVAPPPEPKSSVSAPVALAGVLALCLVAAGAALFLFSGPREAEIPIVAADAAPVNGARQSLFEEAPAPVATAALPVTIKAVRQGWLEVRGADGTIFRSRVMAKNEVYHPRMGAGWTVSARDGGAFEWRVGGVAAGALGADGAPVYAISVDVEAAEAAAAVAPDIAATEAEATAQ